MRLDLVMQHELQHGAGDLVFIDHENPPLVDRLGSLNANLHRRLSRLDLPARSS